ncbi:hypothetical protein [Streptomyces sp. NPDC049040]|uniref:hypothetical protein n=1 Tax=Streptomyces sp. NPDC049040 TaxID=3365593 RepID=UPI00370FCBF5
MKTTAQPATQPPPGDQPEPIAEPEPIAGSAPGSCEAADPAPVSAGGTGSCGEPVARDGAEPEAEPEPEPEPEPASREAADPAPDPASDSGGTAAGRRPRAPWPGFPRGLRPAWPRVLRSNPRRAAAVAVIAVLLLTGGGLGYAGHRLKDPAAVRNHALTDTEATSRLTGDVSDTLSRIFAYTPDDTQSTAQAAHDLLEGAAAKQYQQLFAQIRQQVADQRLTLGTRVTRAGVVSLTGDHARLLVFLDQTAQRAGATATTAAAQLSVTAHLVGGHWRISDLKAR